MKHQFETLGVLQNETSNSPPFTETAFCRKLCLAGKKHRLNVVIFSPTWLNSRNSTIRGYTLEQGKWINGEHPIPRLVYDRMTFTNETQYLNCRKATAKLKHLGVTWLGIGLRGKWEMYRSLSQIEALRPILPPTELYEDSRGLAASIDRHHGTVFMKPHGGSQGRSTLSIQQSPPSPSTEARTMEQVMQSPVHIRGRNANNEPFEQHFSHSVEALRSVAQFVGKRKFVIQPYLTLHSDQEEPYDIRVLMQKNERGRWKMTGMAARVGNRGGITSNLHGGGQAYEADAYLEQQFGRSEALRLLEEIRHYSQYIPTAIEERHGRLIELGLDFGIDRDRKLWLLEANSKPGRSVFTQTGDRVASTLAVEMPILYARYVWVRHLRRVCP